MRKWGELPFMAPMYDFGAQFEKVIPNATQASCFKLSTSFKSCGVAQVEICLAWLAEVRATFMAG